MSKAERLDHAQGNAALLERIDAVIDMGGESIRERAPMVAAEMLLAGERALEQWVLSRGEVPTEAAVEGFRLLALHRQGARGDPSFNACRETCRELAYHYNCTVMPGAVSDPAGAARLAAMVAKHLVLFIDGKLENAGLGEFCCSSRPLRVGADTATQDKHS
jgi:hypothetical protein